MIDRVADRLAHFADLAISSFADADDQHGAAPAFDQLNVGRTRSLAVDDHASPQTLDFVIVGNACDASFVDALDAVPRVGESRRQIAIVCEDQQPLGVEVEPANWIDVFASANQVNDRRPSLRVRSGRHVPFRLVEQ